jgi:TctA family transporter
MAEDMRGRIFSSIDVIVHIAFLVFMVLTSLIGERINKGLLLAIIGLIFSVIGLSKFMRRALKKELRKI